MSLSAELPGRKRENDLAAEAGRSRALQHVRPATFKRAGEQYPCHWGSDAKLEYFVFGNPIHDLGIFSFIFLAGRTFFIVVPVFLVLPH